MEQGKTKWYVKYIGPGLAALAIGIVGLVKDWGGLFTQSQTNSIEAIERQRDIQYRNMEAEDSLRRYVHQIGSLTDRLELMRLKVLNDNCKSVFDRASIVVWYRSDISAGKNMEAYNMMTVTYEVTDNFQNRIRNFYQSTNLDYILPEGKIFLNNVMNKRSVYAFNRAKLTSYDSAFIPKTVMEGYYNNYNIQVSIYQYLGETSDLSERWFLSAWVDSAAWKTSKRYEVINAYSATANDIKQTMHLYD